MKVQLTPFVAGIIHGPRAWHTSTGRHTPRNLAGRPRRFPRQPKKVPLRVAFAQADQDYKLMPDTERQVWRDACQPQCRSGYDLWMGVTLWHNERGLRGPTDPGENRGYRKKHYVGGGLPPPNLCRVSHFTEIENAVTPYHCFNWMITLSFEDDNTGDFAALDGPHRLDYSWDAAAGVFELHKWFELADGPQVVLVEDDREAQVQIFVVMDDVPVGLIKVKKNKTVRRRGGPRVWDRPRAACSGAIIPAYAS